MNTKINLKYEAISIVKTLKKAGFEAFWAGGVVRDLLLRKKPHDYDIATSALPKDIEKLFKKVVPVGRQFGVMIVNKGTYNFEVTTFRGEGAYLDNRHPTKIYFTTAKEDSKRRDFTINALFYDPIEKKVIDFVKGKKDLEKKIIRTVGDPKERFTEDHLRIIRAVRFAANLGFEIHPKTWKFVKEMSPLINKMSQERIRDELIKMFTRPNPGEALHLLNVSGLLKEILPEIALMKGIKESNKDLLFYTQLVLESLKEPNLTTVFSALFLDLGKASAKQVKNIPHSSSESSVKIGNRILKRLKFSNKTTSRIISCIRNQILFDEVRSMKESQLKKLAASGTFEDALELFHAICLTGKGDLRNYRFIKNKMKTFQKINIKPKAILSGSDLIEYGLKPSAVFKDLLSRLYDLQLEGKVETRSEALKWLKKQL